MTRPVSVFSLLLGAGCVLSPVWGATAGAVVSIPVLKAAVEKGAIITPDMLVQTEVSANSVFASTFTKPEDVVGQQAVRPLAAGEALNRMHLRLVPDVARGSVVTLSYKKGGIELLGKGQALEDGKVGQSIRVVNPTSKATLVGTVSGPSTVTVN